MVNDITWMSAQELFSVKRLEKYLRAAHGDTGLALAMYHWNIEVSAALWESIGYLEIGLRNRIDRQLTLRHIQKGRDGHWIFDDARELGRASSGVHWHKYPFIDINASMNRVRRNGKEMTPDQILSEMSFGFWHKLLTKRQLFLWPVIASGFPFAPSREPEYISNLTGHIKLLRNRIGHHHKLFSKSVEGSYSHIIKLAFAIDSEFGLMVDTRSKVKPLLTRSPYSR